ncbi:MAG: SCP2 sterol-binding domain-containing protein [Lachnospiraceae bacterium]|nr:SCP2 sterol-binding domain-containing protein [Lachnospiraceae bacterium]MBR1852048.1 SCP2 sterol-binding domain-containing protein [Lachnospiraceae bacterium]
MKINIYYGGRGIIDDPTNYVIGKMQSVLEELRVDVTRYNLYEMKNTIPMLPGTLKDIDGIILATTVEWFGIGGYMQQFLDACWLYGDKEQIAKIYMCPVVMSTTYGEREAKLNLSNAWEILGGLPCSGLCGYIENTVSMEMNKDYIRIIEKKAENLYRTVNQKSPRFPGSNQAVLQKIAVSRTIDLSPQETEQLSQYASDDGYVQQQKEDIQELASLFRDKLSQGSGNEEEYVFRFRQKFVPQAGAHIICAIKIEGKDIPLVMKINGQEFECSYMTCEKADMVMNTKRTVLEDIVNGRMTFQRAFMSGAMTTKGDMKVLRVLDQIFPFEERQV